MSDVYINDFSEHIKSFGGFPVTPFEPGKPITAPCIFIGLDIENAPENEKEIEEIFNDFFNAEGLEQIESLVIGCWISYGDGDLAASVVEPLIRHAAKFTNLRSLFIGDAIQEESEVSWLEMCDLTHFWAAFPQLETLQIRGTNDLSLGKIDLPRLKSLTIQTGGMPQSVIQETLQGNLPKLEHLELWLGVEEYGGDGCVQDFDELFAGKLFPQLKYLGLRDSEWTDELAEAIANAPILDRLETLDLSNGVLTDKGAEFLFQSEKIKKLKTLDLRFHYMSDLQMDKMSQLPCEVKQDEQQKADVYDGEEYRYPSVTE